MSKITGEAIKEGIEYFIQERMKTIPSDEYEERLWPAVKMYNEVYEKPLKEETLRDIYHGIVGYTQRPIELMLDSKGRVILNEENVLRTILSDKKLTKKFRFNIFSGLVESLFENDRWEALQRNDIFTVRTYLMRTYEHYAKVPHITVEDSVLNHAYSNKISPPVEYIKSIVWDKKKRLDTWLSTVYGTPKDDYHKAVGSNWMKGLVKRLVHPGSKFDYVLVLEGKQGIRKSTSLAVLGGDWHVETVFTPDNKDFFMLFGGKAIVEFSEGETLSRTESKRLKAIITMQFDKYRPPYERSPKEFPRQVVFAMTTNQEQYLKDETGNRRWLPVAVQKTADIEWLKENRDQLFAEAYYRVITKKETTYEFPEEETLRQQEMRQTTDPREEQIYDWYFGVLTEREREEGITTRMAYEKAILKGSGFGKEMTRLEEMVIGSLFRNLKLEKKRVMSGGNRYYRYYPSEESKKLAPSAPSPLTAEMIFDKL